MENQIGVFDTMSVFRKIVEILYSLIQDLEECPDQEIHF